MENTSPSKGNRRKHEATIARFPAFMEMLADYNAIRTLPPPTEKTPTRSVWNITVEKGEEALIAVIDYYCLKRLMVVVPFIEDWRKANQRPQTDS